MEYYYIDQLKVQDQIEKKFKNKYTDKKLDQERQLAPNTPTTQKTKANKEYKENKKEYL